LFNHKSPKNLPEKLPESKSESSLIELEKLPLIKHSQPAPALAPVPVEIRIFRAVRLVTILGAATAIGFLVREHYSQVRIRQAFINAEIIKVRNPIAGSLQLKTFQPGQSIAVGENIGTVKNLRQGVELEVTRQNLISQIEQAEQTLIGIEAQIADRLQTIALLRSEADNQNNLGVDYEIQQVEIAQNKLDQAQVAVKIAQKNYARMDNLAKQGVIAKDKVEQSQLNFNRTQNELKSARSQVEQAEHKVKAARAGLQLEGSRTLSYSEIRQRELTTEINDLRQEIAEVRVVRQTTKAELTKIDRQLKLNQQATIPSPTNGIVWSVESKAGEYVAPSTPIVEVLNCQNRWVEAFFSERNAEKIYPGKFVRVRLLGSEQEKVVNGRVESVRAGSGRVETGEDIAVPPPDTIRRQVAVRIKLDEPTGQSAFPQKGETTQFCNVGRSTEVVFERGIDGGFNGK
jgi:multidrug resistance efflux pump